MSRTIIADLHNHSTASDGEYTPTELVVKAKELGLKAIGITDHDTIEGLNEAIQAGNKFGVMVLLGVEVSLAFKRSYFVGTLHLLLYFTNGLLNNAEFKTMLNVQDLKKIRNEIAEVIEDNVNPQFEELRNDIEEIKATMVTKSYLDVKIADLEGGWVVKLRKEDNKVNRLVGILKRKKVIAKTDVKTLNEIQVFPRVR